MKEDLGCLNFAYICLVYEWFEINLVMKLSVLIFKAHLYDLSLVVFLFLRVVAHYKLPSFCLSLLVVFSLNAQSEL